MAKSKEVKPGVVSSRAIDAERIGEDIENWADDKESDVYRDASKMYQKIQKCFENKESQMDGIQDFYNIYNAQLDENQLYSGTSQCYSPIVRDAINARVKRTISQLFPANFKHVEAVGPTGDSAYAQISLLEHYIRKCNLQDVVRADLLAGDITGQYCLYTDWKRVTRRITKIVAKQPVLTDGDVEADDPDAAPEYEKKVEKIVDEWPDVVPFSAEDLAVYPPTVDNLSDATATCIRLRLSKDKIEQMIDEGVFVGEDADAIIETLGAPTGREKYVPQKRRTQDAGVRTEGTYKYALIYEVHTHIDLGEGYKEPVFIYFAGPEEVLGIIRNPAWSGKSPVISAPIERLTGSFFGISKIEPVKYLQWQLNDVLMMGQDSASYALLPIVMTDPLANPRYDSMVMGMASVWLTSPKDTQFVSMPALWKDSLQLVAALKSQILESMDVTPGMLGQSSGGKKNQAQQAAMAGAQDTNIMDCAKRYEQLMLEPLLERMFELDQQFRTEDLTIATMGEVGVKAKHEIVEPQQFETKFFFRWIGTSFQAGNQRLQQMTSWLNVLRGMPPELLNGRKLDIGPILDFGTSQIFGAEIAPRILIDERNMYTVDPHEENQMMHNGMIVQLHQADDDNAHMKAHQEGAVATGDPQNLFRSHIELHQKSMAAKTEKAMGPAKGQPGVPGGGAAPGVPGAPRPGAQVGQPRPQGPPGTIHPDQMADPRAAGR